MLFGGVSVLPDDPNAADRVLGDTWEASSGEPVTFSVGLDRSAPAGGAAVEIFATAYDPAPVFDPNSPAWLTVLVAEGETTGVESVNFPSDPEVVGEYILEARIGDTAARVPFGIVP